MIDLPLAKQPGTGGEKMHVDEAEGAPGADPLPGDRARRQPRRLGRAAAADRPHPPASRPHGGDRPSDRRRRQIWRAGRVPDRRDQPQAPPPRPPPADRPSRRRPDRRHRRAAATISPRRIAGLGFDPALGDLPLDEVKIFRDAGGQDEGRRGGRRQGAPQGAQAASGAAGAGADAPEPQVPHRGARAAGGDRSRCRFRNPLRADRGRACAPCTCRCCSTATASASTSRAAMRSTKRSPRGATPCSSPTARTPISAPIGTGWRIGCRPGIMSRSSSKGPVRPLDRGGAGRVCSTRSQRDAGGAARAEARLDPRQDGRRPVRRRC